MSNVTPKKDDLQKSCTRRRPKWGQQIHLNGVQFLLLIAGVTFIGFSN